LKYNSYTIPQLPLNLPHGPFPAPTPLPAIHYLLHIK
jgi:hypothetical protein